jgi:hypothetical protein
MAPAHACDICGVAHNAKGRPFASLKAVDAHMRDAHGLRTLDEQEGIECTQYLSDLLNILNETKFPAEMWKNIMPHLQQLERLLTHGGGSGIIDALEVLVKPQVKTTRPSKADPPLAMPDYFSGRHTKPSIVGDYAVGGHNHTCAQRLLNDSVSSSCQCLRYLQAHPDAHSPKLGKRSASFFDARTLLNKLGVQVRSLSAARSSQHGRSMKGLRIALSMQNSQTPSRV